MRRLEIHYAELEQFRREFHRNIANGGVFVPTAEAVGLRERVVVQLLLDFCGLSWTVPAEVVSLANPDPQGAADSPMGVAVQFLEPAGELRDRLTEAVDRVLPGSLPRFTTGHRTPVPRADRYEVRIRGVLSAPNGIQAVMTRDISRTGVLLSIEEEAIPIGEVVNLALAHPRTSEELTLRGHVVRHEKVLGRVVALAVHFDLRPERRSYAHRFLEEVRTHARASRRRAVQGPIQGLGLPSLLQMFSSACDVGTMLVRHDRLEARVAFRSGALLSARCGGARGVKALSRMLGWETGDFEFYAELELEEPEEESTPMYGAVLEAMQYVDELRRLDPRDLAPAARVSALPGAFEPGAVDDKLESQMLALIERPLTVRALLDRLPHFDSEIYAALLSLREKQRIEVRNS
jgi:Tfp pilus assembly protein PilZ